MTTPTTPEAKLLGALEEIMGHGITFAVAAGPKTDDYQRGYECGIGSCRQIAREAVDSYKAQACADAFKPLADAAQVMLDDINKELRDRFAIAALNGMIACSYGEEGYVPARTAADYVEDPEGIWINHRGYFYPRSNLENDGKKYRLATTHEQRIARDAYAYADVMLAARRGTNHVA